MFINICYLNIFKGHDINYLMAEDYEEDTYTEDDSLQEISDYNSKSDFSKARVVCEAVSACRLARAKEMRPGYENITVPKSGVPIRTMVDDSRKAYISSVTALALLLKPEEEKDETYKEALKKIKEKEKEAFDKYAYEEKEVVLKKNEYGYTLPMVKNTGRKFMPRINSKVRVTDDKGFSVEKIGGWDNNHNAYIDLLVEIYDEKFAALNELIDRLNYFKNQSSF